MTPTKEIVLLRKNLVMTVDMIAQLRIRVQVAESMGLEAIAHRARSSIVKQEEQAARYNERLAALGTS